MLGLVRSDAAALGVAQSYTSPAKQSMELVSCDMSMVACVTSKPRYLKCSQQIHIPGLCAYSLTSGSILLGSQGPYCRDSPSADKLFACSTAAEGAAQKSLSLHFAA